MESAPRAQLPPETSPWNRYLLVLALVSLAVCIGCWQYPQVMGVAGVGHGGVWFRDTFAVLTAIDVYRQGLDPYGEATKHYYSHWWFWLHVTGVKPGDSLWIGFLVSGSGLVAGWWMARPRRAAEVGWALAVFCSAPMLLGLNRGNVDLLLFALLGGCVPAMLSPVRFWRIAGAAMLLTLGMGLKYYPAFGALVLLALRPARERTLAIAVTATLFALTLCSILPDVVRFGGAVDRAGFYVFGLPSFAEKFGLPSRASLVGAVVVLLGAGFWIFRRTSLRTWTVPAGLRFEYLNFILGASILTGCFLLTANYAYRWIFGLMLLSFLGRLDSLSLPAAVRGLKNLTRLLFVVHLWIEPFIVADLNLHPRTLRGLILWERTTAMAMTGLTWAVFLCLAAWLVHFLATQTRIAREVPAAA